MANEHNWMLFDNGVDIIVGDVGLRLLCDFYGVAAFLLPSMV